MTSLLLVKTLVFLGVVVGRYLHYIILLVNITKFNLSEVVCKQGDVLYLNHYNV